MEIVKIGWIIQGYRVLPWKDSPALVLVVEIIDLAFEAVIDRIRLELHGFSKQEKDQPSGPRFPLY